MTQFDPSHLNDDELADKKEWFRRVVKRMDMVDSLGPRGIRIWSTARKNAQACSDEIRRRSEAREDNSHAKQMSSMFEVAG